MKRISVILFGPPGSGKGTQAKLIRQCLQGAHISTGDMLRQRIAQGDAVGQAAAAIMQAGQLVPDEMVNGMVEDRIRQADCASGFILDGYPRTVAQAGMVDKVLAANGIEPLVIHLEVDYNIIIERLAARRQCANCQAVYNLKQNPPRQTGICDNCGGALVQRDDDRAEVIRERLAAYERQTAPVLEYFRGAGYEIDAVSASEGAPQAIAQRICGLIERRQDAARRAV